MIGYGSGSKSKVFEGIVQTGWEQVVRKFEVFDKLNRCQPIDYATYEQLHRKQLTTSVCVPKEEFALERIGTEGNRLGARYYAWKAVEILIG